MKKAEFNFAWLFAIIAGVAILVLAIYGVTQVSQTARYKTDTEIAQKIEILTNPLQAGFASSSYGKIEFRQDTKIIVDCFSSGLGRNEIKASSSSGVGEEFNYFSAPISVENKYIFASNQQSNEFYVFSKPFEFPFEVSDLTFLIDKKYCFVSPPNYIKDEVEGLGIKSIEIDNCSSDSVEVCFGSSGCEINVIGTCSDCFNRFEEGYVERQGESLEYVDSLVYAGIFADASNYKCNVDRLLHRTKSASKVLAEKAVLLDVRCSTNLELDMLQYASVLENASYSDLVEINQIAKQLDYKNNQEVCGLWN